MDIAAIRNKAKSDKSVENSLGKSLDGEREVTRSSSSVQGVPVPVPVPEMSFNSLDDSLEATKPNAIKAASTPAPDPLAALFDWNPELELATEEGYDQGLNRQQGEIEEEHFRWLSFLLGDEEYALDIRDIREIIKPRDITDIPRVPDFLLGIISLRGTIIPIFDLKSRLKLGKTTITSDSRIVVSQVADRAAGLLVDRITQVVSITASKIEPPPAVLSGVDRELINGVGRQGGKMMILLNLASVLNTEMI